MKPTPDMQIATLESLGSKLEVIGQFDGVDTSREVARISAAIVTRESPRKAFKIRAEAIALALSFLRDCGQ